MVPASPTALVQLCRQGRLLDAAQLDELERVLLPRFHETHELARELVRRGWLTPWQVTQLLAGRAAAVAPGRTTPPPAGPQTDGADPVVVDRTVSGMGASRRSGSSVVAGLVVVIVLGAIGLSLLAAGRKHLHGSGESADEEEGSVAKVQRAAQQEQQRRSDAEQTLAPLATKVADNRISFVELARDVEQFQALYGGTPSAFLAVEMLTKKKPSPLDALDPAKIPADTRAHWRRTGFAAGDVVAVVGPPDRGKPASLKTVAFSADDTLLLTAGSDDCARLWDLVSGKEPKVFRGERAWFVPGTSAQGRRRVLTLARDGILRLFDQNGPLQSELGKATVAAVSPDGKRVLADRDKNLLSLLDLESFEEIRQWHTRDTAVNAVTFLADGQRAVSVGPEGTLCTWHPNGTRFLKELHGDWQEVYKLVASPSGRGVLIATGSTPAVRVIGLETAHEVRRWEVDAAIQALAISPTGHFAALALPGPNGGCRVRLYDTNKGDALREWSLPDAVHDLAFAPDGRHFVTANADGSAYIFRL